MFCYFSGTDYVIWITQRPAFPSRAYHCITRPTTYNPKSPIVKSSIEIALFRNLGIPGYPTHHASSHQRRRSFARFIAHALLCDVGEELKGKSKPIRVVTQCCSPQTASENVLFATTLTTASRETREECATSQKFIL